MRSSRYIKGAVIKCLEDIYSMSMPDKRYYTKDKEYVLQEGGTIVGDTGEEVPFIGSAVFKRRAFKLLKTRYFIITYVFKSSPNIYATATAGVTTDRSKYINNKEIIDKLKKLDKVTDSLIITNIIELSKEDYEEYYRGYVE